ncbi:MAG TPA: asparagine synthase (glutamine-hydrolyzing) [Gemmatimonadota bacterium]|nr:asparagine synthase (glutamine-hydrolyzing) [Gemmatimonadota bacterium]
MCGIAGIAYSDPRRVPDSESLARMALALRHRGPDGEGFHRSEGIGLAVRRLAIMAPEDGDQPVANEDGTVVLACNGEIYNAPELRRELEAAGHRFRTGSDVEVVVHLYEDRGDDCLDALRGMFALAIWDTRRRRLLLARDRLGIKSLAWAPTRDGLAFGSEGKAIVAAGALEPAIDPAAVDDVMRFGFVVGPRSIFEGMRELLPGERLAFHLGETRLERWWRLPLGEEPRPVRSEREWAQELRWRLEESVRLHLRADVPVAAWLSGGIDSSTIVALAAREVPDPLEVYSLGFEDPAFDELAGGTLSDASRLPLRVRRVMLGDADFEAYPRAIWHAESLTTTGLEIPRWVLSRATARGHRAVLTGEGSDELLGGYWWYRVDRWARPLARLPRGLRRAALRPLRRRDPWLVGAAMAPAVSEIDRFAALVGPRHRTSRDALYSPGFRQRIAESRRSGPDPGDRLPARMPKHAFERLQCVDLGVRLSDYILRKLDRLSMAHGLEVRLPFLDPEVIDLAVRVPPRFKLRGRTEKRVLRGATDGLLPESIRRRRKRGLAAPVERWLRGPLPEFAAGMLSPECARSKGYFDPREVEERLVAHRAGARGTGGSLLGVLAVHLWDEIFLAGGPVWEEPA